MQRWDLNSLSRRNSKFCFISSSDLPVGAPEGLNNHAQSEQPQPWKRGSSIQTIWRRIAALYVKLRLSVLLTGTFGAPITCDLFLAR
jgi:hypothetical protein